MKNYYNKICILLNWAREYDMYSNIINCIQKKDLVLLINDIPTIEPERKGNALAIKRILETNKHDYKFFSEEIYKSKYKILLSTSLTYTHRINFLSFFKFIYGKTIGAILEKTKISVLFTKIFGRPFTANGADAVPHTSWFPERLLGSIVIKYPTGMDLNLKHFPRNDWKKHFDIFFTQGKIDTQLIKNKFENKECKIIGYPRYEELKSKEEILNDLKVNFNFNLSENKKKLFWIPTHIEPGILITKDEKLININLWIEKISELCKDFDVIVRPHPKSVKIDNSIIRILSKKGFFVDQSDTGKIGNLLKISDLILGDYGDLLFGAIYMEKPLLLLNLKEDSKFIQERKKNMHIDLSLRDKITSVDVTISSKEMKQKCNEILSENFRNRSIEIKNEYFGDEINQLSSKEVAKFLSNNLYEK